MGCFSECYAEFKLDPNYKSDPKQVAALETVLEDDQSYLDPEDGTVHVHQATHMSHSSAGEYEDAVVLLIERGPNPAAVVATGCDNEVSYYAVGSNKELCLQLLAKEAAHWLGRTFNEDPEFLAWVAFELGQRAGN